MVSGGGRWEVGGRAEGKGNNFVSKTESAKEAASMCQGMKHRLGPVKAVVVMASRRHADEETGMIAQHRDGARKTVEAGRRSLALKSIGIGGNL